MGQDDDRRDAYEVTADAYADERYVGGKAILCLSCGQVDSAHSAHVVEMESWCNHCQKTTRNSQWLYYGSDKNDKVMSG